MMNDQTYLARIAFRAALQVRKDAEIEQHTPLCVFDLAERRGVEVKFRPEKSMDGMYRKGSKPLILVSTFRPAGRRAFNCGHELGHHFFNHGTRVDEYIEGATKRKSREERLADLFAGYLLMPSAAIRDAIRRRGFVLNRLTPIQAYIVACNLGVGYQTLIQHLSLSLKMIGSAHAQNLGRHSLKNIRRDLLGRSSSRHVVVAGVEWNGRPIDLEVGDLLLLPASTYVEGSAIRVTQQTDQILAEARHQGTCTVETLDGSWSSRVRVSRKNFIGRSIFRHLEDPDDEDL